MGCDHRYIRPDFCSGKAFCDKCGKEIKECIVEQFDFSKFQPNAVADIADAVKEDWK